MSSLNKVIIIGNLGRDPEVRTFQNGGKVVNLRIATSEKWRDKDSGEQRERTEWHSVAIFADGIAKVAEQYLRKGSKVYLEGQLETRKWQDQSGQDRYSTEIVLRPYKGELVMLDGKPSGGEQRQPSYTEHDAPQRPMSQGSALDDDEIPFSPEVRG